MRESGMKTYSTKPKISTQVTLGRAIVWSSQYILACSWNGIQEELFFNEQVKAIE